MQQLLQSLQPEKEAKEKQDGLEPTQSDQLLHAAYVCWETVKMLIFNRPLTRTT